MQEIVLTYPTPDGSRQMKMEGQELTIGRGEVDLRFADNSMSRHHATIFHENERVWILDEGSTNGTFVNGVEVSPSGTPLDDGDEVRVGNETIFRVNIIKPKKESFFEAAGKKIESATQKTVSATNTEGYGYLPITIVGLAVLIIGIAGLGIGIKVWRDSQPVPNNTNTEIAQNNPTTSNPDETEEEEVVDETGERRRRKKKKTTDNPVNNQTVDNSVLPTVDDTSKPRPVTPTKTYQEMSDAEKREFIRVQAEDIAVRISNVQGESITPVAIDKIKGFLDGYVRKIRSTRTNDCSAKGWLSSDMTSIFERATVNAKFINPAFNAQGVPRSIGLYLAMIESEHCQCLQSYTGPLGMFQFTKDTANRFGLKAVPGANPSNALSLGDERCKPDLSAAAAARYFKYLLGRYGTDSSSVPLAIASYNSGEGAGEKNLEAALKAAREKSRSFWTLVVEVEKIASDSKYGKQFKSENIKYVPKFFAAAIIGENPKVFGINGTPLSLVT
jgi:hypothetical protein